MRKKGLFFTVVSLISGILLFGVGCSAGPMKISEKYYLEASDGYHKNYYRIRIDGDTKLGVAEFRQGWYAAEGVDALFGDVSAENAARSLTVRDQIKQKLDDAIVSTHGKYLKIAQKLNPKPEELIGAFEAMRRVRSMPVDERVMKDSDIMEYNPAESLVTPHRGQKLVMMLSSNPDQIISKISALAEEAGTLQLVTKVTDVIGAKEAAGAAKAEETASLADATAEKIGGVFDSVITKLSDKSPANVKAQLASLLSILQIGTSEKK